MDIKETLYVKDREEWRAWLEENGRASGGIWLVYYKKHTGKPRIPYDDAVEEALCFGWIDSTVKRIDDERFIQRFTPRKKRSGWSELNKKRANRMIRQARMTEEGMARIREAKNSGEWKKKGINSERLRTPPELLAALRAVPEAYRNFKAFAPSYRKTYIGWVSIAKRKETREKRISEVVRFSALNKKPGMM